MFPDLVPEDPLASEANIWQSEPDRWRPDTRLLPFPPPVRLWLNTLLLLLTLFTTTLVGTHMQYKFGHNLPMFDSEELLDVFLLGWKHPELLLTGLPFSLTLLTILMAHELGHYFACVYYRVDATLPFFLPAPTPFTGTLGAFIRIKSPIFSKKILFDIGIAGPLAGFLLAGPALAVGLAFSRVIPGIATMGSVHMGSPGLLLGLERIIFAGSPSRDIALHPIARAAWVGMFATALNLLPAGQLDGGHIIYALFGKWHRWISYAVIAILGGIGFLWDGWWFWAILLLVFARKHPPVFDSNDIGPIRKRLACLALLVFALCFCMVPFQNVWRM